jgi:predicted phage baseplate assembly protein
VPVFVEDVLLQPADTRTKVILRKKSENTGSTPDLPTIVPGPENLVSAMQIFTRIDPGVLLASVLAFEQPENQYCLKRDSGLALSVSSDVVPQMLLAADPGRFDSLYPRLAGKIVRKKTGVLRIYAMRFTASLFGHNALLKDPENGGDWDAGYCREHESDTVLFLDGSYEKILPGSYIAVQPSGAGPAGIKVRSVFPRQRDAYGIRAKVTGLNLEEAWTSTADPSFGMARIRETAIFAQSELLAAAEEPVTDPVGPKFRTRDALEIELDGLYDGIRSGRWIIVSGERADIEDTEGVMACELAMVVHAGRSIDEDLPGDTVHTILYLASPLKNTYRRDSVAIYANVVRATHGGTRTEILGSGDSRKTLQQFALRQSPLTHCPAPSVTGTASTLTVRVNEILWHEADSLEDLAPGDRNYLTRTDDEGKTAIIFGNGVRGSRLPTGVENVRAVYRTGIGRPGNVKAGQVSILGTKPLGVKGVTNPFRASGGADPETRDQARRNAPLATMALDRIVSARDYAGFARNFAGIDKADAREISDGFRQVIHLTIAGTDDIPIDETSEVFRNLGHALGKYGDPGLPVMVAVRELLAVVLAADVKILPDYSWEATEPRIRARLLDAFGFDRRELVQNLYLSDVIGVIQRTEGVDYAQVRKFSGKTPAELQKILDGEKEPAGTISARMCPAIVALPARIDPGDTSPVRAILPAQMAYFLPDVPDALILNEVTP